MSAISGFFITVLLYASSVAGLEEQTCDSSKLGHVIQSDAQAYIGVVLAMHESADSTYGCGAALDSMKAYEAMRWALGRVNQDSGFIDGDAISESYIPGVKIGLQVHDSCSRPEVSTAALFDLVPNMAAQESWCQASNAKLFLGVISGATSDSTAAMARLLGEHKVAQISYSATAPSLRDRAKYSYLLRTVRPAIDEARAMVGVAVALNWTYISVLYTDSTAGREGFTEFSTVAKEAGVCITLVRQITETGTARITIEPIIADIIQAGATGVVYFGELQGASSLFAAAEHVSGAGNLQWLIPGSVGNRDSLGLRQVYARGVIAVTPASSRITEFEQHWSELEENNPPSDNPWYQEWYMTTHECRLNGINYSPFQSYPFCQLQTPSAKRSNYRRFYQVESSVLAVYSYAKALKLAHSSVCGESYRGLCDSLKSLSPQEFYDNFLRELDFTWSTVDRVPTLEGKRVAFSDHGELESSAEYDVWSFSNARGDYAFTKVGSYYTPLKTTLDLDSIVFYSTDRSTIMNQRPLSQCPNDACTGCVAPSGDEETPDYVYSPGEVLILGMFPVGEAGMTGWGCGKVTAEGALLAAAYLYAFERVADLEILASEVRLGGLAFDECGESGARNVLTELASGSLDVTDRSGMAVDASDVHALFVLNAGNNTGMLPGLNVPLVGTWPRPSDRTMLARVTPSVDKRLRALILTLKRLQWKSIQLVHGGDTDGCYLATQFKDMAAKEGICAAMIHKLDGDTYADAAADITRQKQQLSGVVILADASQYRALMGAFNDASGLTFVISVDRGGLSNVALMDGLRSDIIDTSIMVNLKAAKSVEQFQSFLRTRTSSFYTDNRWFAEWYESTMNCYLDASDRKSYSVKCKEETITTTQSPDVINIINSVEVIARGLATTLRYYCGDTYTAVCTEYRNSPERTQRLFENILQASFVDQAGNDFRFVNQQADLPFEILNIQSGTIVKLGAYLPGPDTISLDKDLMKYRGGSAPAPTCPGSCAQCDYVYDDNPDVATPNADILIGGIFDVHSAAMSPLSCGEISPYGYPYMEALSFALDMVNSGKAPVRKPPGVSIGTVTFDGCSSSLRAAERVAEYHADIKSDDCNSGAVGDIKRLVAWVTQTSTAATLEVGDVTRELGRPHLGVTSGSVNLTDPVRMATFFNLQGTEDKLAQAIIRLVIDMGWKYVQVVHEESDWGRGGLRMLQDAGKTRGVCTLSSYEIRTDGTPETIITKLKTSSTDIVIMFLDAGDVIEMLDAKQSVGADANRLIFIVYDQYGELNISGSNTLTFHPDIAIVPEFEDVLTGMSPNATDDSTAWFREYYESVYRCDLKNSFRRGTECDTSRPVTAAQYYHANAMVRNVMNAVYAIISALDLLLQERCGPSYSGVCNAFWESGDVYGQLITKLEEVSFTDENGTEFKFTDRQYLQGYTVYQTTESGQHRKVATYLGSALTLVVSDLSDDYETTTSACGSSCTQCQYTSDTAEPFEYMHGDIIIGGVFDVHVAGGSAFTCGSINPHQGVQLTEAFKYAISVVNNHQGLFSDKLAGVTLGGLSLDACESATRAGNLIANLHSGYQTFATSNGVIVPGNIAAYVGAMDSDTSKQMARVLNVIGVPQVSYGATSVDLGDASLYPYFLRTVPADDKQARAMIALLARFGVKYVQVVLSPSSYGTQGAAEFVRQAKDRSICVAQNTTFDSTERDSAADGVVTRMLERGNASVVIVFLDPPHIQPFLAAVQENVKAHGHFHFIGSEVWADNRRFLESTANAAAGAVILGVETADLVDFDGFLNEERPGGSADNAWFDEYFQLLYQCNIPSSSEEKYPKTCSEETMKSGAVLASTYQQDPYVLYTVNAVYAAALGVDAALTALCGVNYTGVCSNYRNNNTRSTATLQGIRAARFKDATKQVFEYNDQGESSRGYHIYTITKSQGGSFNYYYDNVGSYNDTNLLKIDANFEVNWDSDCDAKDSCSECPLIGRQQSRYMQQDTPGDVNIIGLFDVHGAGTDSLQCGELNTDTGFYNLLAFFYALDQVNAHPTTYDLPANTRLGATAVDTCGSPVRVTADIFAILSGQGLGWSDGDWLSASSIVAYIVGGDSANSVAATELLSPRHVTTVSPTATAVLLSGAPYFLRTVPPNDVQAAAMADISAALSWVYFSTVTSDTDYGTSATDAFVQAILARNNRTTMPPLCLSKRFVLYDNATDEDAEKVVKDLDEISGSNVVVLFTSPAHTRLLLSAAKALGLEGRFMFLGSEQWGNSEEVVVNLEDMARGALTLQVVSGVSAGLRGYVTELTVASHGDIPDDWFDEFWQRLHKCRLENATVVLTEFTRICSLGLRITEAMVELPASALQTTIATQQVALGLGSVCQTSSQSLAACLSALSNRNAAIYEGISSSEWVAPPDELVGGEGPTTFKFTEDGYGDSRYNVYNYQKIDTGHTYEKIGSYKADLLSLDTAQYVSYDADGTVASTHRSQCPLGRTCSCTDHTGVDGQAQPVTPDTAAQTLDDIEDNFGELWGIVLTVLTIIGILTTLFMFVYLLIFYPVRGGTSVLGFLLLFGVLLVYVDNFAFILRPTDDVCAIRRFSLGFVYAVCFACMLIKVLNTWSVESQSVYYSDPVYRRLAHPLSLFLIALALIAVQAGFATEWLILTPARYETVMYEDEWVARCSPEDSHYGKLIMSCIYVMFLIATTFVFSLATWDSEENHGESRFIFFVSCFTIVIWIVWTIVATMTEIKYEDPAVIVANLVNATVILVLIFVRKMWLLRKYERKISEEKRSRVSSFSDKDAEVFHNISYIDDTGHHASTLGGSAVLYHDGSIRGADAAY